MPRLRKISFGAPVAFKLSLSEADDASARVQGSLGLRLLYHTRGSVLRGIDVGVSKMCLGERALLRIRPDYAYDDARPGPLIPKFASLEVTVDLMAIAGETASMLVAQRAFLSRLRLLEDQFQEKARLFEEKRPFVAFVVFKTTFLLFLPLVLVLRLLILFLREITKEITEVQKKNKFRMTKNTSQRFFLFGKRRDNDESDDNNSDLDSESDVDVAWYDAQRQDDDLCEEEENQDDPFLSEEADVLDFDDVFSDEEIEEARRRQLRPAQALLRADKFQNCELSRGLTKLDSSHFPTMVMQELPIPQQGDDDDEQDHDDFFHDDDDSDDFSQQEDDP